MVHPRSGGNVSYVEPVDVWINHPVPRQIATGHLTLGAEGLPKFTFSSIVRALAISYTPLSFPDAWVLLPKGGAVTGAGILLRYWDFAQEVSKRVQQLSNGAEALEFGGCE